MHDTISQSNLNVYTAWSHLVIFAGLSTVPLLYKLHANIIANYGPVYQTGEHIYSTI